MRERSPNIVEKFQHALLRLFGGDCSAGHQLLHPPRDELRIPRPELGLRQSRKPRSRLNHLNVLRQQPQHFVAIIPLRRVRMALWPCAKYALALAGCDSFDPLDKFQDWDLMSSSKTPLKGFLVG